MTDRKRKLLAWALIPPGLALHLLICSWSTRLPPPDVQRLARMPNPVRMIGGGGSTHIYLGVSKQLGGWIGIIGGLLIPTVLIACGGVLLVEKGEIGNIAAACAWVVGCFGVIALLIWGSKYW